MGVSYSPLLVIGKEFWSRDDAEEYLRSAGKLEGVEEGIDIDEYIPGDMHCGGLDLYTGEGYYIGYRVKTSSPEEFRDSFVSGMEKWNKEFGDAFPPDIIHTVRIS